MDKSEEKRFSYHLRDHDRVTIVDFIGELDMHTLPDAVELVNNLVANEKVDLLVNLSRLKYIDSSGLGFFTGTLKKLQRYSGTLKLCSLSSYISRIFSLIHIDYFVEIYDSVEQALQAFSDTSAIAEKKWKKVIDITPEYADAYYNLGKVYFHQGEYDKAVLEFKKALDINPAYSECHNALGEVFLKRGNEDSAIECFTKANQINPGFADALFNLAACYNNRNMLSEAVIQYKKAVELNPSFADYRLKLGVVLQKTGHIEDSIKELRNALEINPNYAEAHYHIAKAYIKCNDHQAARPHLLKVKELALNSEKAIEAMELLDEIKDY